MEFVYIYIFMVHLIMNFITTTSEEMQIMLLMNVQIHGIMNIMKFFNFFSGKKTYIVGALMIALGLLQGDNQMVLTGLGFITVRQGISKIK